MKTMSLKLMFLVVVFHAGCYGQPSMNLENTVWINNKIDNCTSELQFSASGECRIYYCGLDELFSGKYFTKADTVVIKEYHLVSETPERLGEVSSVGKLKSLRSQFVHYDILFQLKRKP